MGLEVGVGSVVLQKFADSVSGIDLVSELIDDFGVLFPSDDFVQFVLPERCSDDSFLCVDNSVFGLLNFIDVIGWI